VTEPLPPNPVPHAEQADYAGLLGLAQPRGRLWNAGPGSIMAQLRQGASALMAQFSGQLSELTEAESYPPTSVLLLGTWNEAFGLPDPCTPLNPTIEQQQQALAARLAAKGGLSIPSITAIAAALGYTITITEFAVAVADYLHADGLDCDPAWAAVWQVNAPDFTIDYFCADTGRADDPLESWGNTILSCTLQRICPPNTILIFNFG
jgi:uncharacterized protein YmfQ (DUF2313 family)